MRTINLLATFALILVVMFNGCKNDNFEEVVGVCPEVILTVPANRAVDVPLNQIITANFNTRMNPTTINGTTFLVHSGTTQISGTVTYSGITATFTPSSPLAAETEYKGTITTESKDLLGNRLMKDYTWTFTTLSRHTVTLSSNPTLGGTSTGGATYDKGASVTVSATPNQGYTFTNWTEGTNIVSSDSSYTFVLAGNRVLAANFTQAAIPQFNVNLSGNPAIGGTTSGAGAFDSGASVNISAIANQGYTFTNWTEGANVVSTTANFTFIIASNRVLVANFTETTNKFNVSLSSNPTNGGTTNGGGTFDSGSSVTVAAIALQGYTFTNWTEGANIVSTNANYTFNITSSRVLVANFTELAANKFNVSLSSNPTNGGTTNGGGAFDSGSSVTVSATASEGFTFTNWTEGANIVSTNANYTFNITANKVLVANFTETTNKFNVGLSSNPALGGTTSGGGEFDSGASVTVSAIALQGYTFTNWTEGTNIVSTNANYTFNIASDRNLVANFTVIAAAQFDVSLTSNPALGGTTNGGGAFDSGISVTISAIANQGYSFTNWTEGSDIVSTNANYTFNITRNRVLVANFTETTNKFNVGLSSNPANGGTTSGGGDFDSGVSVTVSANANNGFSFLNWTEGTDIVSTNANYTFNITDNRVLVANFEETPPVGPVLINLGSAGAFSILTKSGISSTGITSVQGDIGVSPAAASAITGFGLIMDTNGQSSHTTIATHVTGKVYASDYAPPTPSNLTVAISDMEIAYTTANNLVTPAPVLEAGAGNISGLTLAPGLYKWSTGVLINPDAIVTLSGGANDTWVFQIAQDLTLMSKAQIRLQGGAQAKNIIWVVAGQAVLGTESVLFGTIMSKTLISLNTGSKVTGRLLAQTAVTLNASTVVKP